MGLQKPIGHVDFYVNGGTNQPGCPLIGICSHSRAVLFYAESINSRIGFYGRKCKNETVPEEVEIRSQDCRGPFEKMGGNKLKLVNRGIFYLVTTKQTPFAKGKTFYTL